MFNPLTVIIVFCIYMGGLFVVALLVERKFFLVKNFINNPVIYSLAMAVYCTAWTYYGSVGKAVSSGMLFLTIYLGPTLMIIFWWTVLRKLVRLKSTYRITSIADFISARYNKSPAIAAIATIIAFFGSMPYIALQFKAIFSTFTTLTAPNSMQCSVKGMGNVTVIVIGLMILFTIVFGLRRLDPTERHQGMMAAVAIENIVQLFALLVAGIFVCFFLFNGFGDVLQRFKESSFHQIVNMGGEHSSPYSLWSTYFVLAMSAIMFLPRQFHSTVVENTDEKHIRTAMWLFPLYMFLINIFVLPIAMGGLLKGYQINQADQFVLLLPLQHGNPKIALIVFLGGFSAATSMIMVTSMTMSTMITNHLLLPLVGWFKWLGWVRRNLLRCRWVAAAVFIITGYWFGSSVVGETDLLVNIGLISFAAALQFAPVILGGIFWTRANKAGAMMGLTAGFIVWFYTLIIPEFVTSGIMSSSLLEHGPWGIGFLNPEHLFGVNALDPITHSVFWTLLFNVGFYVLGAFYVKTSVEEQRLAEDFVGILKTKPVYVPIAGDRVYVNLQEKAVLVENLLKEYFPPNQSRNMVGKCLDLLQLKDREMISVTELAAFQNEVERRLAGSIGTAVAHKVITDGSIFTQNESKKLSSVYGEILATLKVTPQELKRKVDYYQERTELVTQHAQELSDKIKELEENISERKKAEQQLKEATDIKLKFVSMVSHELRTPLTVIKDGLSLVLTGMLGNINDDQKEFLFDVNKSVHRLTRLINDVLDFQKLESYKMVFDLQKNNMNNIVEEAGASMASMAKERGLQLIVKLDESLPLVDVDKDRIMQVLTNLIDNGIKFTEAGSVTIATFKEGDLVGVYVHDTGIEIKKEDLPKLFSKFEQLEIKGRRKIGGTGLGLAICKDIIEQHGGKIWVHSEPKQGTTFYFTIPVRDVLKGGV